MRSGCQGVRTEFGRLPAPPAAYAFFRAVPKSLFKPGVRNKIYLVGFCGRGAPCRCVIFKLSRKYCHPSSRDSLPVHRACEQRLSAAPHKQKDDRVQFTDKDLPSPSPPFRCLFTQPWRRGRVRRERAHRMRQHLELPADGHLRGAFAQDPRSFVPDRLIKPYRCRHS